ncbi:ribonuclease R [Actinobacillus equuli]|nr:ribonuclease R [Actinobacillus equuli]
MDLIKGTVVGHRDGYGFLQVEGGEKGDDWFIPNNQMTRVMHGDLYLLNQTELIAEVVVKCALFVF